MEQKQKRNRLILAVPIFGVAALLLWYNIADENGFNVIWRYFGLANQALAAASLWMISAFLNRKYRHKAYFLISMLPACFISSVCVTFVCVDKIGFGLPSELIPWIAVTIFFLSAWVFFYVRKRRAR